MTITECCPRSVNVPIIDSHTRDHKPQIAIGEGECEICYRRDAWGRFYERGCGRAGLRFRHGMAALSAGDGGSFGRTGPRFRPDRATDSAGPGHEGLRVPSGI